MPASTFRTAGVAPASTEQVSGLHGNPNVEVERVEVTSDGWHVLRPQHLHVPATGRHSRDTATRNLRPWERRDDLAVRHRTAHRPVDEAIPLSAYVNAHPDGILIETAAGLLDADTPEVAIRRETSEELGVAIGEVQHLFDLYMSPGSVTERVHFYAGRYSPADRTGSGGGVPDEGEDIEVLELPFDVALDMVSGGEIVRR